MGDIGEDARSGGAGIETDGGGGERKEKELRPGGRHRFYFIKHYFSILNPWMFATRRASMYINGVNRLILIIV
jgi:hypothetical protein